MRAKKHQAAAKNLDAVTDEHHPPFRHGVSKRTNEGGEQDVGNREESFEQRLVFGWRLHFTQSGNRCNQKGVVGEC